MRAECLYVCMCVFMKYRITYRIFWHKLSSSMNFRVNCLSKKAKQQQQNAKQTRPTTPKRGDISFNNVHYVSLKPTNTTKITAETTTTTTITTTIVKQKRLKIKFQFAFPSYKQTLIQEQHSYSNKKKTKKKDIKGQLQVVDVRLPSLQKSKKKKIWH